MMTLPELNKPADPWHYLGDDDWPTRMGEYLVAVEIQGEIWQCIAEYFPGDKECWFTHHEKLEGFNDPIAWMPLPDPPKKARAKTRKQELVQTYVDKQLQFDF